MNNQEEDLFEQALIDLEEESETSAEPIDGTIEERIKITVECLRSITLEQLRGISHRYVSDATLQAAMSSLWRTRQFVVCLLKAMERNEINEYLPQSLSKILDDIPIYPPIHQEEKDSNHVFDHQALLHENWNNKCQFYLIEDHPLLGFRVQNEPTDIHYGVCSECHKAAPINAMCPSSSRQDSHPSR